MEPLKFCKYGSSESAISEIAFQLDLQQRRRKHRRDSLLEDEEDVEEVDTPMQLEPSSLEYLSDSPNPQDPPEFGELKRKRSKVEIKPGRSVIRKKDGSTFGREQEPLPLDFVNDPAPQSLERQQQDDDASKSGKPKRLKKETSERKRTRKPSEKDQIPVSFDQVPWIPFEDDIILRGVKMFGENWSLITEILNSSSFIFRDRRTRAQCHARFHSHLKATLEVPSSEVDKSPEKVKKVRSVAKPPKTSTCILEIMKRKARDLSRIENSVNSDVRSSQPLSSVVPQLPIFSDSKSPATLLSELKQQRLSKQSESRPKPAEEAPAASLPTFHAEAVEHPKKPPVILPAIPHRHGKLPVAPSASFSVEDIAKVASGAHPTLGLNSRPTPPRNTIIYPNPDPRTNFPSLPTDANVMHASLPNSSPYPDQIHHVASSTASLTSEMVFGHYPGKNLPVKKTPSTTRIPRGSKAQAPPVRNKDTPHTSGPQATIPMSFHAVSSSEYSGVPRPSPTNESTPQSSSAPSSSSSSSTSSSYSINEHYVVHPLPSSSQPSWNPHHTQGSGYNMYSE